jgi:hypothetical protein
VGTTEFLPDPGLTRRVADALDGASHGVAGIVPQNLASFDRSVHVAMVTPIRSGHRRGMFGVPLREVAGASKKGA